jgi:outer membrane protein TolC
MTRSRRWQRAGCLGLMLPILSTMAGAQTGSVALEARSRDTTYLDLAMLVRTGLGQNLQLRAVEAETRAASTFTLATRSRFDPVLGLGGDSERAAVGGQLSGLLPSGARYLLGSVAPAPVPGEPIFPDALVASVTQPLLRGFGPRSALSAVKATDEGVSAFLSRLQRTRDEVAADIAVAYAVLVERHRQEAIAMRSLRRAEELYEAYAALHALDQITRLDLITAQLGVESRRASLLSFERERREAEDALVFTAYGSRAVAMLAKDGEVLMPGDTAALLPMVSTSEEATVLALGARPDVEAARREIASARYRSQVGRNALLPALDLTTSAIRPLQDEVTGGQTADGRSTEWIIGVTLSRPVRNAAASAERQRLRAMEQSAEIGLSAIENQVRAEVRAALRDLAIGREQAAIAATASRLANEQYAGERERLALGLSDLFRVLQYDEQVARVEHAEASAWLALAAAGVRFRIATGRVAEQLQAR